MSKKAKRMIVLLFAIIGLLWVVSFSTKTVLIPLSSAALERLDYGVAVDYCRYNRNPHIQTFEQCMKNIGH